MVAIQTETGTMRVSTPEATAFDLVRFAPAAGHIGNVVTVLGELAEKIDPQPLAQIADLYALSDVQRLGYLLEQLGEKRLADPLAERLQTRRYRPILLAPGQAKGDSPIDPRWRIIPNERGGILILFLDASEQLIGDTRIFEPHDALFRTAEAQEVDAPIPNDFLIEHRKFLVDVRFEHHLDTGCME